MEISFIGAGNLAWHLAQSLFKAGFKINGIYSRNIKNARKLSDLTNSEAFSSFENIKPADFFIISIPDDALINLCTNKLLKQKINNKLVVHTAGSVEMNVLENLSDNFGVFYPLQTFSKQRDINFTNIPICIEANSEKLSSELFKIGEKISNDLRIINSVQRKYIHISAVFSCNFVNYLYSVSEDLLKTQNIDFSIMLPIIQETANKLNSGTPKEMQTGPAIRNDIQTMNKHLDLLEEYPNLKKIYNFVSNNINETMK